MSSRNIVFQTEWFNIEEEFLQDISAFQGKPFYKLNAPDGVIILALTKDEKIILVRQFRPAVNQYTLELPSGQIEEGETLETAVAREFYEETGYKCNLLSYLGKGRVISNRSSVCLHAFFTENFYRDPNFTPQEAVEVVLVSIPELKDLVLNGEFQQMFGLSLLMLAKWRLNTPINFN